MSRRHLVFAFVAWHLTAIVLGALPKPGELSNFPQRTTPGRLGPAFDGITTAVDGVTKVIFVVPRAFWWLTTPIHSLAARYRALAGAGQSWAMFSNPPQYSEYLRTRYYVKPTRGRVYTVTELVSPALREDQIRLVRSYRASYEDKAVAIATAGFYRRRKPALIQPGTRSEQLPDDLVPIGRYFARKYSARVLDGTGDRIMRTEVWAGRAPMSPLGAPRNAAVLAARAEALQAYYDGPVEERLNVRPYPPYHAG
jgi:hypothetical protein